MDDDSNKLNQPLGDLMMTPFRFEWNCDECRRPINDGEGYVLLDRNEMRRRRNPQSTTALGAVDLKVAAFQLENSTVSVLHHRCDPSPAREDQYWVDIDKVRTIEGLVNLTQHLMEKQWLHIFDWMRFFTRAWNQVPADTAIVIKESHTEE